MGSIGTFFNWLLNIIGNGGDNTEAVTDAVSQSFTGSSNDSSTHVKNPFISSNDNSSAYSITEDSGSTGITGSDITNNYSSSASSVENWSSLFDGLKQFYQEAVNEERAYNEEQTLAAWNRTMDASNTSYQRAVADLEAAGLNSWLAVNNGASTPSSAVSGSSGNVTGAVSSATSLLSTLANISLSQSENTQGWMKIIAQLIKAAM